MADRPLVTMYSRPRCGLCDLARRDILSIREEISFRFEEVMIDGRDDLEREYGLRVPVVLVDGEEEFELEVDPARLRALLGA
ncbi:MAG: glutaredoxin family protein [Actinomycetota bacterium]